LKQLSALVVGLFAIGLAGVSAAGAQPGYGRYSDGDRYYDRDYNREYARALSPYDAVRVLRRAGFSPLSAPARRGNYYVVIAAGREGNARVYVNVYGGEIVGVRPVGGYRYYGERQPMPPRGIPYGRPGADSRYDDEPDSSTRANNARGNAGRPVPPRAIKQTPKSPRVATAPATGASTGPTAAPGQAHPPVPRPRPAEGTNQSAATTTTAPPSSAATSAPTKTAPVVAAPEANPPAKVATPAKTETAKTETAKTETTKSEAAKAGAAKAGAPKTEVPKAEAPEAETTKTATAKGETAKAGTKRGGTTIVPVAPLD
jgi:hypothetical protein